ncbi:DUF2508 family protein [Cohnella zeiphila]|uniref:DUF2508 family protein n=1 Tax=Cohnella zeiphila TaxID=2761120 RepID=A0A7X0VZS7_9BACL|nr:DUF2508 family protein [Cohnella zeiphila]MBB6735862.1 DUF2508 family protein [Cohnella zeiphila]
MFGKIGRKNEAVVNEEKARMVEDIRLAQQECATARSKFDEALDFDQVDYAVYTLEAAEKKLDILIRKAKQLWGTPGTGSAGEWEMYQ